MKIIKTYTEQTTGEKLYSTLLSENEYKLFSKMEDEDYLDDQRNRKKSVKHAKASGAFIGGTVGAGIGGKIGAAVSKNALKGGLIGAGIGAASAGYAGYKLGKAHKKATEEDADREINRYKNASEADKKYLRKRREKQKERELQERQARAQEQIAWNSYNRNYSEKEEEEKPSEGKIALNNIKGAATIGGAIGVLGYKNKNLKKAGDIAGKAAVQSGKIVNRIKEAAGEIEKRSFKDKQAKEAFEDVLKKGDHYIKTNLKGSKRAFKVAAKMDAKGLLKRGAKGAAIGAGVGALTYGAGKLIDKKKKKDNEDK